MRDCPDIMGKAKVIMFTPIDGRHALTDDCKQIVAGTPIVPIAGLAICQHASETVFYLFGCDKEWNTLTDTWHQTIQEAIEQAEFEYRGSKQTWEKKL